jgi:HSP20 family protein
MSDIKKELQNVEKKIEQGVVESAKKLKETFANVASHLPLANLSRNRDKDLYRIEVDLPGVAKEDIDVAVDGDYLIVTAERKMSEEVSRDDYYLLESVYGKFERSFYLPEDIDRDSIEAEYRDGRLLISFEKVPAKKRRDIAVK